MLNGVWRAEQGVGAIAAHSHMADFPRVVILFFESFFLPLSFLRYSYIFLCLILGPMGAYFFIKYSLTSEKDTFYIYPAAFLGALFYLLNLATLQNFYVPFEMFTTAFAFAPWIAFFGTKYIKERTGKTLLFFGLIIFLAAPMAYAATLWYVTMFGLFIYFFVFALLSRPKKVNIKKVFVLGFVSLLLNLYWLLPSFYSISKQSQTISNSNINRLFSQEAFLRNSNHGTFYDIVLQRNFLFDWRKYDFSSAKFTDLLEVWNIYYQNKNILEIGLVVGLLSIAGIAMAFVKKNKIGIALVPAFIFALFFLININPPSGFLYSYLYKNFSIFAEGLRMPFTKFSILFELFMAFYLGVFSYSVFSLKTKLLSFIKPIFFISTVSALVIFALPAFGGELIAPNIKTKLPNEYMRLFEWFNSSEKGNIAFLPANSKYGWEYRSWGYEGSGFLTYGIESPMLYRDFDRWNIANEDFYNQISYFLYSNDVDGFSNLLKKYQIKYLLLDESTIAPGWTNEILKIDQLKKDFIVKSGFVDSAKFGFLTVFESSEQNDIKGIKTPKKFTQINSNLNYSTIDPVYTRYGDYVVTKNGQDFPFVNLDVRSDVEISLNSNDLVFKNKLSNQVVSQKAASVVKEDLSVNRGFLKPYNCDLKSIGGVGKENSVSGIRYWAEGGGVSCDYLGYPELKYKNAYILRIKGENKFGRGLKFYLFNMDSMVPDLEEILPTGKFDNYFFVYPKNMENGGYVLNFETRSFGRISSENVISAVEFYEVNYEELSGLTDMPYASNVFSNNVTATDVKKYGNWGYKVTTNADRESDIQSLGLIQLSNSYEDGWIAFSISPKDWNLSFLNHVKVNSWSNGWLGVYGNLPVYIFYWPQLLEWVGMVGATITVIFLVKKRKSI